MSATFVVTGASTGIGRATARHLVGGGHTVLAGVRSERDADALRADGAEPVLLDVTDADAIAALAERVGNAPLAGLVNNAGIVVGGPVEMVETDDWRRQLDVNVVGQAAVTRALLEPLRSGRGRIVFVGSVGGRFALPYTAPYNASKFAIAGLAGALRIELLPQGVRVVLVEPGSIKTDIWDKGETELETLRARFSTRERELYSERFDRFGKVAADTGKRGISPDKAAAVIAHALTTGRPRARYVVGADAKVQLAVQALLPRHVLDRLVARFALGR